MFCFWKNLREKYEGKKIERKGKRKEKEKEKKIKINKSFLYSPSNSICLINPSI